jgi:hypothetical protein
VKVEIGILGRDRELQAIDDIVERTANGGRRRLFVRCGA